MGDSSIAIYEPDGERSRRLKELLEFAHFEPVLLEQAPQQQKSTPPGWVAAVVGCDQPAFPTVLTDLRRADPELPIVAFGAQPPERFERKFADLPVCAYVAEPIRYRGLVGAIEQARRARRANGTAKFPVGSSRAIKSLERLMQQVAAFDTTVLIEGESGVGKELVARQLHLLSERRDGAFVPVNCAAIPRELLESELFGHEKGAFTGAITNRLGRFELADGGTLFLDEIGDMSPDLQVKFLRVLQERVFERVGSTKVRHANVRIVAATNRNLHEMVAEGKFREDLFFRVHVFPLTVPSLRDRIDDLPDLVADLVREGGRHGRPAIQFSDAAMARLRGYRWPGNVRELANLIERLAILCPDGLVDSHDLPPPYGEANVCVQRAVADLGDGLDLKVHLSEIEKELIRRALADAGGTVAHAAKLLNLQRTTLVEKLRKYDL